MQTQQHTTTTNLTTEDLQHEMHKQLHDAEELTNDLKRLLVKYEALLTEEGAKEEVETLERWMESYRRGLVAASKISESGPEWLSNLHSKLKLAAEEMQRIESEGGNPSSREQAEKIEELLKALRRIEKVIPDIEQVFTPEHA